MAAIVFDVRNAERKLKAAGASDELAEATADLMSQAVLLNLDALVTKDYLDARLDARFSELDVKFKAIDARFIELEARFKGIDARFNELEVRFESIDAGFEATGGHIDGVREGLNSKIDRLSAELESKMDSLRAELESKIDSLRTELKSDFRLVHAMLAILMAGVFIPQLQAWFGG